MTGYLIAAAGEIAGTLILASWPQIAVPFWHDEAK
jgi:hypothetical protein